MNDFYNRLKFSILLAIIVLLLISINFCLNLSSFFQSWLSTFPLSSSSATGTSTLSLTAFFKFGLCVYPLALVIPIYLGVRELLVPFLGLEYSSKPWHYPLIKSDIHFIRVFIIFLILLFFPYYSTLIIATLFSLYTFPFFSTIFFACFTLSLISFYLLLLSLKNLNHSNQPIIEIESINQEQSKSIYLRLLLLLFCFWNSFIYIAIFQGPWSLLLLLFLSALNDSICYLFGRSFGKTKFTKHSTNKTIEGLIAGIVLSSLLVAGLAYFIAWLMGQASLVHIIVFFLLFCLLSCVSNLGDLYYSRQKRQLGIKDFSNLCGNHGGFADRFDSHCFVLNLVFIGNVMLALFSFFLTALL